MVSTQLNQQLTHLATLLQASDYMLATAESCTGGLLAASATDIAGSSAWFSRALVTYSNNAKHELLGVSDELLAAYGAVSQQTVEAMVNGLLGFDEVSIGVSISGIAGPGGGSTDKPVGTVWIGWQLRHKKAQSKCFLFDGDRQQVRYQAAIEAVNGLISLLESDQ